MTECLLIDDDIDDQEIFSMAMRDVDPSVRCVFANDGVHGLEKLNRSPQFIPHCIFIDMNMPRMNGMQCLTEIKKMDHLKDVPVYMYSTSADPIVIDETKQIGAVNFIIKPYSISDLTLILRGVLFNDANAHY